MDFQIRLMSHHLGRVRRQQGSSLIMLKLGRRISPIEYAVPVVITVAAVGLCFPIAGAYVAVTYKRAAVETKLGSRIANFLYGVCDPAYQAFVDRRRSPIAKPATISERFAVHRPASPITEDEEAEVIGFIERAFGWKATPDARFSVYFGDNGHATFRPYPLNIDQIEIDECGYLIGDDYAARQRHADHLRKDYRRQ